MAKVEKYFRLARQTAVKGDAKDAQRQFRLGAVGIRSDGTIVTSSNLPARCPDNNAHAEARLVKKLDWDAVVYVVRIRSNGSLAMARPCRACQSAMRLKGVRKCYFSVSETEYGVMKL